MDDQPTPVSNLPSKSSSAAASRPSSRSTGKTAGTAAGAGAGKQPQQDTDNMLDDLFGTAAAPKTGGGARGNSSKADDDGWGSLEADLNKPPASTKSAAAAKPMKLGGATKLAASAADDWEDW